MFISYLTSAANDICKDAKRQTISAEDVFTALQDLDFGELISPTKDALEGVKFRPHPKATVSLSRTHNNVMHALPALAIVSRPKLYHITHRELVVRLWRRPTGLAVKAVVPFMSMRG